MWGRQIILPVFTSLFSVHDRATASVEKPLLGSEQDTDNLLNSGQLAESKAHITGSLGVSLSLSSEPWDVHWTDADWFSCVCKNHKLFPPVSVKFVIPVWMQMPPLAAAGIFLQTKSSLSPKAMLSCLTLVIGQSHFTAPDTTLWWQTDMQLDFDKGTAKMKHNPSVPFSGALSIVVCADGRKLEESLQCSSCQEL